MSEFSALSRLFCDHYAAASFLVPTEDGDPLEAVLSSIWLRGSSAYPTVQLSAPLFVSYIAERIEPAENATAVMELLERLHVEDLFLTCACFFSINEAIQKFDQKFIGKVPAFLSHMRLDNSFSADIQQELRKKLLTTEDERPIGIAGYHGRGDLSNWLRAAAIRMAISRRRKRDEQTILDEGSTAEKLTELAADPVLLHMKQRYGAEIKAAIESAISKLNPEQRNLLRFHYIDRLSTPQIATMFGINQSNISRRLIAIRQTILQEVRDCIQQKLRLSDSDFFELTKQIQSQLQLSLSRILRE